MNRKNYNKRDNTRVFIQGVIRNGIRAGIENALRQQQNETSAPPSYHEAINTATPPPPQDSLPPPRLIPHPNGHSPRTMSPLPAYCGELTAQERDNSTPQRKIRRHHAERVFSDLLIVLKELQTHVEATEPNAHPTGVLRRHKAEDEQRELVATMKRTIESQREAIQTMRRKKEARDRMIERRDRMIQEKNDCMENMSALLQVAEAALKEKNLTIDTQRETIDTLHRRLDAMHSTIQQKNDSMESRSARLESAEAELGKEEQEATFLEKTLDMGRYIWEEICLAWFRRYSPY